MKMIDAQTLTTFVVFSSDYAWGKGTTIPEAKRRAKDNGASPRAEFYAYFASDDVAISTGGFIEAKTLLRIGRI